MDASSVSRRLQQHEATHEGDNYNNNVAAGNGLGELQ